MNAGAKATRPSSILDEEDEEVKKLNVSGNEILHGNGAVLNASNPPSNVPQPNYFQSEGILVPVQLSPEKAADAPDTSPNPQKTSDSGLCNDDGEVWDW